MRHFIEGLDCQNIFKKKNSNNLQKVPPGGLDDLYASIDPLGGVRVDPHFSPALRELCGLIRFPSSHSRYTDQLPPADFFVWKIKTPTWLCPIIFKWINSIWWWALSIVGSCFFCSAFSGFSFKYLIYIRRQCPPGGAVIGIPNQSTRIGRSGGQ